MKVRPAAGMALDEAMDRALPDICSWEELFQFVAKWYFFWDPTRDNVTIQWYARDDRIDWDTHIVCVDGKAALFTDGIVPDMPVSNILPSPR